jgi:hypothetical protein
MERMEKMDKRDAFLGDAFSGEKPFSFLDRLEVAIHVLFCPSCAEKIARLEAAEDLMRTGFFPSAPSLGDAVMSRIMEEPDRVMPEIVQEGPPELSLRRWVITGFIVLVSLGTAFFGINFEKVAQSQGASFLLPVGLTIGVVITSYGALFIASHLKELTDRFGLH